MEQHAVPQNISSYQFHLVGDMTLKQFLEIGAGVLVAVLLYASGLPGIIKWPLILISVGFGAALAFVPFEERPLERWIFAFFRSVYSPTMFRWEKKTTIKYFADETVDANTSQILHEAEATRGGAVGKLPFMANLENSETSFLTKLSGIFTPATASSIQKATTAVDNKIQSVVPQEQRETVISVPVSTSTMPSAGTVLTMHADTNATPNNTTTTAVLPPGQRDVQIPRTTFVSIDKTQTRPQIVTQEIHTDQTNNLTPMPVGVALSGQNVVAGQAQFSADAAPPSLPTIINTVSGQVMDANMKIVDGAILEILDDSGRPVRALKSNRAGHFLIVTPLPRGTYTIVTDKEGIKFEPVSFNAEDNIIAPIAIKANPS